MPTTLDCELLRDLYGTDEVRAAFDSHALVQAWLDVEVALAEAQAEVGIVPPEAAQRIREEACATNFDLGVLRSGIAASKHPLVPLIRALGERCGEAGAWVHWGATTQDVVDTGFTLQARAALVPIARDLDRATRAAAVLADRYADTPMAGRTHFQHAVPITFGLKAATWADELDRARQRLGRAGEAALTAQLSGAAGTFATLGGDAEAVQEAFSRRLGLARADVHWHATRDRVRDLGHALAELVPGERARSVEKRGARPVVPNGVPECADEVLHPRFDPVGFDQVELNLRQYSRGLTRLPYPSFTSSQRAKRFNGEAAMRRHRRYQVRDAHLEVSLL